MSTVQGIQQALYDNYSMINRSLAERQISNNVTKLSINTVLNSIMHLHIPYNVRWEGLFANDPVDRGGPTMRGVTIDTFCNSIKFILSLLPTEYDDLKGTLPFALSRNDKSTIDALQQILNTPEVATIWVHHFYYISKNGNLFLVSAHDPYMGFLIADKCWMSGSEGCWNYANFLDATRQVGYTGNAQNFGKWVHNLTPRQCVELSGKFISNNVDHIMRISRPGDPNGMNKFRKGWLNRLINDTQNSLIAKLIQYVEKMYTKNIQGASSAEMEWLNQLGEAYKSIDIQNISH